MPKVLQKQKDMRRRLMCKVACQMWRTNEEIIWLMTWRPEETRSMEELSSSKSSRGSKRATKPTETSWQKCNK